MKDRKASFKTSLKILTKTGPKIPFIKAVKKLAVKASSDLSVDRPVDRARSRSIGRSTDVHKRAQPRAGRPHSRPPESLCSLKMAPVDRAVDWQRDLLSLSRLRSTGSVDRLFNGQKSDRWSIDRQQDLLLSWPPTATFWEPIKGASLGLFSTSFKVGFQDSF